MTFRPLSCDGLSGQRVCCPEQASFTGRIWTDRRWDGPFMPRRPICNNQETLFEFSVSKPTCDALSGSRSVAVERLSTPMRAGAPDSRCMKLLYGSWNHTDLGPQTAAKDRAMFFIETRCLSQGAGVSIIRSTPQLDIVVMYIRHPVLNCQIERMSIPRASA